MKAMYGAGDPPASTDTSLVHRYEATADGYDPVEKASELYSKLSRFVVVSSPDSPSTPVAYSMFRFDHEETRTDSLAAVVYWFVASPDVVSR